MTQTVHQISIFICIPFHVAAGHVSRSNTKKTYVHHLNYYSNINELVGNKSATSPIQRALSARFTVSRDIRFTGFRAVSMRPRSNRQPNQPSVRVWFDTAFCDSVVLIEQPIGAKLLG